MLSDPFVYISMLGSRRFLLQAANWHFLIAYTLVNKSIYFFCVGVVYSGEYDVCDVTLSVYPNRASLKNMPGHGGNRTYDPWNTSPMLCQLSYARSDRFEQVIFRNRI